MKKITLFVWILLIAQIARIAFWVMDIILKGPSTYNIFGLLVNFVFGLLNVKTLAILAERR